MEETNFIEIEDESARNPIQKNLPYLTKHITNLDAILDYLIAYEIISENESQEINKEKTPKKKYFHLLSLIQRKGWTRVKKVFLEILEDTHNEHCVAKIENMKMKKVKSRQSVRQAAKLKPENLPLRPETEKQTPTEHGTENVCILETSTTRPKIIIIPLIVVLSLAAVGSIVYFTQRSQITKNEPLFLNTTSLKEIENVPIPTPNKLNHQTVITTKDKVLKYLKSISDSKTISGITFHDTATDRKILIDTVYKITGEYPGIVNLFLPRYLSAEAVKQKFIDDVVWTWNNGSFVQISWDFNKHPFQSKDIIKPKEGVSPDVILIDILKDGSPLNKEWKKQLDFIAPILREIQSRGIVAICDFLPFINARQLGFWGGLGGSTGRIAFYKLTYDYLTKYYSLNSIIWTLSFIHTNIDEGIKYWPGDDYVDTVSVTMGSYKELSMVDYNEMVKLFGNKPLSMDCIYTVPSPELLIYQPRWTWFTVNGPYLKKGTFNHDSDTRATFQNPSVINRGDIDI